VTPLARSIRGSSGVAFDRDGNVLQASFLDNRIVRITPEGVASDVAASGLDGPVGLTVRPDGTILVCNCRSASVTSIGPDGASRVLASGDLFDCPNGITLGPDGGAYVTNYNDGRVVRVDTAGTATLFATVPEGQNAHIAFAGEAFYVTKIASHRIYRVSLDGQNVEPFAGNGEAGFTDGPALTATLAHPNGIAVSPDSTALYINTLDGPWKGEEATRIVLRRISLP
jgi:sugar lactone lactonase YvrE